MIENKLTGNIIYEQLIRWKMQVIIIDSIDELSNKVKNNIIKKFTMLNQLEKSYQEKKPIYLSFIEITSKFFIIYEILNFLQIKKLNLKILNIQNL